jgi:hypothetical protein
MDAALKAHSNLCASAVNAAAFETMRPWAILTFGIAYCQPSICTRITLDVFIQLLDLQAQHGCTIGQCPAVRCRHLSVDDGMTQGWPVSCRALNEECKILDKSMIVGRVRRCSNSAMLL